ncbi:MAG: response regulator [Planctomycetes bacterium]|nr:response regulator [Planctomycetota bacterium]
MSLRLRILVVEGQHTAGQAIAGLLRRRGHSVELVASAEDALAAAPADVLVSDLDLPGASGLQLLEELRRRGARARVVFVGARPTFDESRRALELGATDLLSKPFRMGELVRAVEAASAEALPEGAPTAPVPSRARAQEAEPAIHDRSYSSSPACVEQAARELAAYALRCGVSPAARARIGSAASEIIDNARRHGYCRQRGSIRVEAELDGADLSVRISDQGIGFDASALDASGLHDTLRHGIARARALAEELEIESRPEGGTRVLLVFRTSQVAFEEEHGIDLSELDFLGPELSRRILNSLRQGKEQDLFHLSPALAVVVGRLLAGPDPRPSIEQALWS